MGLDVVRVENVSKLFTIRKQKSLKESLVNARQGRRHQERFTAINDLSVTIEAGQSVGLIGPNGSGKSTLLKIIGGILAPDVGHVFIRGRVAALLELGAGFHPDLSGRENVYLNASLLGLSKTETQRYFDEIVDFSGIPDFIDTQVKFYSSGMYVRLAFSVAVHVNPDILLVDEVLAVGDEPFQMKCMDKIRQFQHEGRTIVFVSHSAGQVMDVCDRAVVLEDGCLVEDSTPIIALGRLRRDYQDTIDADSKSSDSAFASSVGTIERVYLTGPESRPHVSDFQTVLFPGDDLKVHLEVAFPQPVPGWHVEVCVQDAMGRVFLACDSLKDLKQDLQPVAGPQALVLTLPDLHLTQGDFQVQVTLYDGGDAKLDQISRAGAFALRTLGHTTGFVDSVATLELTTPAPRRAPRM